MVVYVADSIHAVNIEVRNKRSPESAKLKALKMGNEILQKVSDSAIKIFTPEKLDKIYYAKWDDLLTPQYQKKLKFLKDKYSFDLNFRNLIIQFISQFTRGEARVFSQDDLTKLGTYLVDELPELLMRVPIKNLPVDAHVYPFDSEFLDMVEKIQNRTLFPEIADSIIDTPPKVFLEVRD